MFFPPGAGTRANFAPNILSAAIALLLTSSVVDALFAWEWNGRVRCAMPSSSYRQSFNRANFALIRECAYGRALVRACEVR